MHIRRAAKDDVEAMARVLVASITELCGAEHGDERANIERWTANKSPGALIHWIADAANRMFVADEGGEIVCVGSFRGPEIQLNYVAPSHRFRGVSKAMLERLEAEMQARGITLAQLNSTATARQFYRSAGWMETGEEVEMFGFARAHPMTKKLG